MRAVVTEVLIGKEKNLLELSFDHCGTFLPELRSLGIFFVNSSGEVIPVYNNNGAHFVEALRAIEKFRH
jgi:hypothetical protein